MFSLLFGLVESIAWLGCRFLAQKGVIYRPVQSAVYDQYLMERDPLLGWPSISSSQQRHSPMHQNEAIPCVSLFGDSFTFAAEVSDSEAWGNVLAGLLGCRVANYGVGGYGSDQAFLAMKSRPADGAGVVFLNHLSENILRNVNQF